MTYGFASKTKITRPNKSRFVLPSNHSGVSLSGRALYTVHLPPCLYDVSRCNVSRFQSLLVVWGLIKRPRRIWRTEAERGADQGLGANSP